MPQLGELACLIRSKNAGPFELTFDIMFDNAESFARVRDSNILSVERIAAIYRIPPARVRTFVVPAALAIKITIPRPRAQGDLLDGDGHGGQQYGPLVQIDVP
jgi:hypothetical protein